MKEVNPRKGLPGLAARGNSVAEPAIFLVVIGVLVSFYLYKTMARSKARLEGE